MELTDVSCGRMISPSCSRRPVSFLTDRLLQWLGICDGAGCCFAPDYKEVLFRQWISQIPGDWHPSDFIVIFFILECGSDVILLARAMVWVSITRTSHDVITEVASGLFHASSATKSLLLTRVVSTPNNIMQGIALLSQSGDLISPTEPVTEILTILISTASPRLITAIFQSEHQVSTLELPSCKMDEFSILDEIRMDVRYWNSDTVLIFNLLIHQ